MLRDVRLDLGREDKVWVSGPNGAGKSTLLGAVLAAARLPEERVMYVPQEIGEARHLQRSAA